MTPTRPPAASVSATAGRDALREALRRVEALHAPFTIYDTYNHEHTDADVDAGIAVDVDDVGYVCPEGVMYVACRECCTHNGDQTEDCASYHEHTKDGPRCPTLAALDGLPDTPTRQSSTTRDGVTFTVDTTNLTIGLLRAEVAALRADEGRVAELERMADLLRESRAKEQLRAIRAESERDAEVSRVHQLLDAERVITDDERRARDQAEARAAAREDDAHRRCYTHPECGFHWHNVKDGMDMPLATDGFPEPVCPRCEVERLRAAPAARPETDEPLRHLLSIIAGRIFPMGDCLTPVGPDERCGDCPECWVRNVEKAAAALAAPDRAGTDTAHRDTLRAEVVTLCGSTRYKDAFMAENQRLTMEGRVVISLGVYGHTDLPDYDWTTDASDLKRTLDGLHFQKIDMADRVHVVNPGGYIGESTAREIAYAKARGLPVTYMDETAALAAEPVPGADEVPSGE